MQKDLRQLLAGVSVAPVEAIAAAIDQRIARMKLRGIGLGVAFDINRPRLRRRLPRYSG